MRRGLMILLLLATAGGAALYWRHEAAQPGTAEQDRRQAGRADRGRGGAGGPIPVLVAASQASDVPVYLDAIGTVQAYNTVSIRPMVNGPLTEMRFTEGQDVKAGDVIARVDPRPYQASLDQYTAKKAQDEATLANARLDLARYQKLAATAYTSGQTADTQRALVAQDEALVRQDQAQIDAARTQLGYTTIASPIDGRTGVRQVDVGNIVQIGDATPITVITQLRPISVVFTLPQQSLPQVAAAMRAGKPAVLALPQGASGKTAGTADHEVLDQGQLTVLDNQVDAATGTIKLKATFPNPSLTLWPGGFVDVRLLVDTRRGVVTVPPSSVQRGPNGSYLYVVDDDGKVARRAVTTGYEDEDAAVITHGLRAGEQVVTDGASRLTDGARVAPSSGAAPDAGPSQPESRAPGAPDEHGRHRRRDPS